LFYHNGSEYVTIHRACYIGVLDLIGSPSIYELLYRSQLVIRQFSMQNGSIWISFMVFSRG